REGRDERKRARRRLATRGEGARGRTRGCGARLAYCASTRLQVLQRALAADRSCAAAAAHRGDSGPGGPREPDAIPRAAARHGNARARTEAAHALARLRGFVDFWDRQRAICLARLRMVWPTYRRAQAGPGNRLRALVDDSGAVCRDCVAAVRREAFVRAWVGESGALRGSQRRAAHPRGVLLEREKNG